MEQSCLKDFICILGKGLTFNYFIHFSMMKIHSIFTMQSNILAKINQTHWQFFKKQQHIVYLNVQRFIVVWTKVKKYIKRKENTLGKYAGNLRNIFSWLLGASFKKQDCKINGDSFLEVEANWAEEQMSLPKYRGVRWSEILETDRQTCRWVVACILPHADKPGTWVLNFSYQ